MLLEALWQYCHALITYTSACRVILATTDHVTHGTISHVQLGCAQQMTNIRATKTHVMNACMAQTHIQFTQMTNLASVQATQPHVTMKLPIKQNKTHTNNKITWGNHSHNDPGKITLRSFQSRQIWQDPPMWDFPVQFLHWWYLPM